MRNYAVISELKRGLRYFVRVSAASIGGFGQPTLAIPHSLLLSSSLKNFNNKFANIFFFDMS